MRTSPAEPGAAPPVLVAEGIVAGYGTGPVVRDVSIVVPGSGVTVLIGPNGSGKSTLLRALTGGLPVTAGAVYLAGEPVTSLGRHLLARRGLAYVPQTGEVFDSLTVRENLEIGGYRLGRRALTAAVRQAFDRYPLLAPLRERRAGHLSGGERKLLAVARAMMVQPRLVVLDEPTAGLAPRAADELLGGTLPALAAAGAAVLLVEQRVRHALSAARYGYLMVDGTVAIEGPAADLAARADIAERLLGAGHATGDA